MQENKFAAVFKQNAIWIVFILEIIIFALRYSFNRNDFAELKGVTVISGNPAPAAGA